MAGACILIVEDEARIAQVLERYLHAEGFKVEWAADGPRALTLWRAADPDLIVLDLMIPPPDGLALAQHIRQHSDVPIIMLTAKAEEADRLAGLECGADDYVVKPFSPRELVARIKAVLRRAGGNIRETTRYAVGAISVDMGAHEARCHQLVLPLSPTQLRLLATLATQAGRAVSRQELAAAQPSTFSDERTIDAHVKNLRRRLGPCSEQLETVRGVGYRLRP